MTVPSAAAGRIYHAFFLSFSFHFSLLLVGTVTGFLLTGFSLADLLHRTVPMSEYFQYIDSAVRRQQAGRTTSRLLSLSFRSFLPLLIFRQSCVTSFINSSALSPTSFILSQITAYCCICGNEEQLVVHVEFEFDFPVALGWFIDKNKLKTQLQVV